MPKQPRRPASRISRLAKLFGAGDTPAAATRLTLAPRRLEPRRMLDAAAPALALETLAVSTSFAPASDDAAYAAASVEAASANTPPADLQIQTPLAINENGVVTLELSFNDPDLIDSHTIEIDWNDGHVEIFNIPPGNLSFSATHQYLDDNLTGAAIDPYVVTARVTDAAGDYAEGTVNVAVNNVAPSNLQITPIAPINENGVATLKLTFDDPGTLDSHTVEVDWGDGSTPQQYILPGGNLALTATHQYLDDNPTATATDNYTVSVRVIDDDLGETTSTAIAKVNNVAPSNVIVTPVAMILPEGGQVSLAITFADPGAQDTHKVEINWGDGNTTIENVVGHAHSANHVYGDNGIYVATVKVVDDDGGAGFSSAAAFAFNAAPSNVQINPIATVDENSVAILQLTFDDPGTLDSHAVQVDWGDGTVETLPVAAGARTLTATHKYLDDSPTGTASDVYTVKATVTDDDGGSSATATSSVTVKNVPPTNVVATPIASILAEGGQVSLSIKFDDVGTQDTHTVEINWGDGSTTIETVVGHTHASNHTYLDNGTYVIGVKVIDDDGGVGNGSAVALVTNVAPSNAQIAPIATINENGVATLTLTFDDPGTLDSHTVEVDWGDGTPPQQYTLPVGDRTFTATHQYLDDNPTGTPADVYAVKATLRDDDGGSVVATSSVTVNNVAPTSVVVTPVANILAEGGQVSLSVTFADPGSQDTHQVEINWGDGHTTIETVVGHAHSANHTYLDNGTYVIGVKVIDDDGGVGNGSAAAFVSNVAPSNVQIAPIATINENGAATLTLTFDDPGTLDSHTVEVDWGDGTIETLPVAAGARTFTATHQYLDDNPTGTASDVYTVKAKVTDDDGGSVTATSSVTVNNVAPSNVQVAPVASINENGVATLTLTFDDPGTLDSHTVEVDWGDGTIETLPIVAGARTFTATHQYLDDNPTGTSSDVYTVKATVRDDDGGSFTATTSVTVTNVAPSNLQIAPIAPINENGVATLTLTFADPGTLDVHTVEINWGDGSPPQQLTVPTGDRTFTATHQYLDDDPTGTPTDAYLVTVKLLDDDGGSTTQTAVATAANVVPSNVVVAPVANIIDEGGQVSLGITFDDPGSQDTHTVEINWGDGHITTGTAVGHALSANHTYADNGIYVVLVKVIDDDGGVGFGSAAAHVNNVAPTLTVVGDQTIDEGAVLTLPSIGQFTDPGFNNPANAGNILNGGESAEDFTYSINWGDGSAVDNGVPSVQNGSAGTPTSGSFSGSHIYADNGVYTVTVTIKDDDGGVTSKTFLVTVNNVAPSLTPSNPNPTVEEGKLVTLAGLGVGVTDPGFDDGNLGTVETLIGESVDWGDGTGPQSLSIATIPGGGPTHAPTTGTFSHADHYYADNGTYTVTVRMRDDDGNFVDRTFTIEVTNVAPSLKLTDKLLEVDEGSPLVITDLAEFWDPGFDNPANAGNGETEEYFNYTINWGDGTTDSKSVPKTNGGPGVLTSGSFGNEHTYLDNDGDNIYTITVTLYDDDGGVAVKTIDVKVRNVPPKLAPLIATDVNSKGEATLDISFFDPGRDDFTIVIDWGDNNPPEEIKIDATDNLPTSFQYTHKYEGPPDPSNPTKDIKISVQIRDDDFNIAGVDSNLASNVETVEISLPGLGAEKFRIDTTPQVAILTFPDRQPQLLLTSAPESRLTTGESADMAGGGGDSRATSERYLELRIINPDGSPGEGYRLPSKVLNNLPALFRNLPDNHYAIYLVQSETNARRLVIDVFARNGKLIDPGDDSEGARDRPPTEEATSRAVEEPAAAAPRGEEALPITPEAPTFEPQGAIELPVQPAGPLPSSSAMYHRTTLAGVAIALSGAGRTWHKQLERALAEANPQQLKRLRTAGYRRPKKPR